MTDHNHIDQESAQAHDILDLSTSLDASAVEEHLPIFESLIEELKVDLDF